MKKTNLKSIVFAAALGVSLLSVPAAEESVASQAEEIKLLKQQLELLSRKVAELEKQSAIGISNSVVQDLDQKVRVLERQRELDQEAALAAAKTQPKIVVGPGGLSASSADTNFVFSLKGLVQVDSRTFFNNSDVKNNDGFLLRRARPIFQGTLYRDFDFRFVPDFGGNSVQIFDAYANYRYEPWAQLRAGKFKSPIGLEQLQEDVNTSFNERSLVTDLVPSRDVGLQFWGLLGDGVLAYAAGVFNGVGDSRNSANSTSGNNVEFVGRLFAQPFKNTDIAALQKFGAGIAASTKRDNGTANSLPSTTGGALPGYTTDGQQQFFAYNPTTGVVLANGQHWRLSPQSYYYYGPFGLLGEYAISDQGVSKGTSKASLHHTAWQISGGWVLTGEDASYNGVTPLHPFDPRGGQWGALQLVARYAELNLDDKTFPTFSNPNTSASGAQAWAVGLNWYLNKNIRLNTSYSRTTFDGGGGAGVTSPATITRQPEEVLFTRIQLAF